MSDSLYLVLGSLSVAGILLGIVLMSRLRFARLGNAVGGASLLFIILVTLGYHSLFPSWPAWVALAAGSLIGAAWAARVKMIQMPQVVAMLNGLGGAASALVAGISLADDVGFYQYAAQLALVVGAITLSGSGIAAAKLAKWMPQKPVCLPGHTAVTAVLLAACAASVAFGGHAAWPAALSALLFGAAFAVRVGGADMPITISLLNSLSGVAGGIAGIAIANPVLIAVGGIVGASGLLLTQIMCRAMNRSLSNILLGKTSVKTEAAPIEPAEHDTGDGEIGEQPEKRPLEDILRAARDVIIVPGYGMALSQAQAHVRRLSDALEAGGARVRYAIHPVAGRMPGHMNVLLCEADVPYDQLFEMDDINADFASCDLAIAVGANDTINPAANTAEGTPIYGMPVLNVGDAPSIVVINLDDRPGYAGVPNPLFARNDVYFLSGDAKEQIENLLAILGN